MKTIHIPAIEKWIGERTDKTHFGLPEEARGGLWVDIGCEVGGLIRSYPDWADRYVGYDIGEASVSSTKEYLKSNGISGDVIHAAVKKDSGKTVKVYAHWNSDEQSTDYYQNIANISTQLGVDERGYGWKEENQIGTVKSISFADIQTASKGIKVLKITIDNVEEVLLKAISSGITLSNVEWLIIDLDFAKTHKEELEKWIEKTHTYVHHKYYTLYKLGVKNEKASTDKGSEELEGNNSTEVSGSTK